QRHLSRIPQRRLTPPWLTSAYRRPDSSPLPPPPRSPAAPRRAAAVLVLPTLLALHGWTTLWAFDAERPWQRLVDDQPVVSGRHPFHLYHACCGAAAYFDRGTFGCYDPAFA